MQTLRKVRRCSLLNFANLVEQLLNVGKLTTEAYILMRDFKTATDVEKQELKRRMKNWVNSVPQSLKLHIVIEKYATQFF